MPAQSKSQQSAFGLALAARKGEIKPEQLQGAARRLFKDKSLSNEQLTDYASTKQTDLPNKLPGQQPHIRAKR